MANKDHIRPLAGVPDHGFGLLGRLAHSVLAEYAGTGLPVPQLHLGQNTLPNPPFPMAAEVPFGDLSEGWQECGADLALFLKAGARALRNQPIPDVSAYSERIRTLQRVLRFDSIAMVWHDPARGPPCPARYPPAAPRRTSRSPTSRRPTTTSPPASCATCCSRSTSGRRPCSALCPKPCRAGEAAPARSPGGPWIAALPPPGRHGTG